jgi:hypothetical protein
MSVTSQRRSGALVGAMRHAPRLAWLPVAAVLLALPSVALGIPPSNDNFANAQFASSFTVTGTNVEATKESGEPNHAGNAGGASVWWVTTAPTSATVTIDTCSSNFDTLLAIYTGSSVNALTEVASNNDFCGNRSQVTFQATAGTTYYAAVDGFNGATGSITLALTVGGPPPGGGGGGGVPPPITMPTPPGADGPGLPEADCPASAQRYTGSTSQGEKICFTLDGKRVRGLEFTLRANCTSGSLEQFTEFTSALPASRNIRNHKVRKFSFSDDELEVKGKIKGRKAKGTLEFSGSTPAGFCNSGNVGWSAQKG